MDLITSSTTKRTLRNANFHARRFRPILRILIVDVQLIGITRDLRRFHSNRLIRRDAKGASGAFDYSLHCHDVHLSDFPQPNILIDLKCNSLLVDFGLLRSQRTPLRSTHQHLTLEVQYVGPPQSSSVHSLKHGGSQLLPPNLTFTVTIEIGVFLPIDPRYALSSVVHRGFSLS